jgi:hypothetical protein
VRATRYSLATCIDCHVQYDMQGRAVPVNGEDQFCDRCHDRLAVHLDCFGCHSPVPQGPQLTGLTQREEGTHGIGHLRATTTGAVDTLQPVEQEKGN